MLVYCRTDKGGGREAMNFLFSNPSITLPISLSPVSHILQFWFPVSLSPASGVLKLVSLNPSSCVLQFIPEPRILYFLFPRLPGAHIPQSFFPARSVQFRYQTTNHCPLPRDDNRISKLRCVPSQTFVTGVPHQLHASYEFALCFP